MTQDTVLTRFTAALASARSLSTLQERLCEASRVLLDADGAVIVSDTADGRRTTVCWSNLLSRRLGRLQDVCDEGPLIDSLRTGDVAAGDFASDGDGDGDERWPELRREVAELDFAGALISIPLRSELPLRGALLVNRETGGRPLDAADARFLGAAIGTAVLQDPSLGAQSHVFAEVLIDRDVVHRACDALGLEADVRYEDALALLRALAYTRGQELGTMAQAVVDGRVSLNAGSRDDPTPDD